MWNTLKYTALSIIRERSVVIWVFLFPLILATLFSAMFGSMDENARDIDPVPVGIVDNSENGAGEAFSRTIDALSDGETPLISPQNVDSVGEAFELLKSGETVGTITVDSQGWPSLEVSPGAGEMGVSMAQVERTILADVVSGFSRSRAATEDIIADDPPVLSDPHVTESFATWDDYAKEIAVTHSVTSGSVRYFYALLGFTSFMAAMVALHAVGSTLPNITLLGARRTAGGTSRMATLAGAVSASWIASFAALLMAFVFIRFVLGVEFGGREPACMLGIAVAALMATAFGAMIGAIPSIPTESKGGILTGITCLLSLFAGLYGTPAMQLADQVARDMPMLAAINPVKQVTDLFYCLYVYTDLGPFFQTIGILLIITAFFSLVAALLMRRQKYASI